jgi:hypothetical protein
LSELSPSIHLDPLVEENLNPEGKAVMAGQHHHHAVSLIVYRNLPPV